MDERVQIFVKANRNPGRYDDITKGYTSKQIWVNDKNGETYECAENKAGFAVWKRIK